MVVPAAAARAGKERKATRLNFMSTDDVYIKKINESLVGAMSAYKLSMASVKTV
jgi:hypothetical protein